MLDLVDAVFHLSRVLVGRVFRKELFVDVDGLVVSRRVFEAQAEAEEGEVSPLVFGKSFQELLVGIHLDLGTPGFVGNGPDAKLEPRAESRVRIGVAAALIEAQHRAADHEEGEPDENDENRDDQQLFFSAHRTPPLPPEVSGGRGGLRLRSIV